jgi:hypothetical protein
MHLLELDEDLLSNSTKQKWKSAASKLMCHEAYKFVACPQCSLNSFSLLFLSDRRALAEMETEDGPSHFVDLGDVGDVAEESG